MTADQLKIKNLENMVLSLVKKTADQAERIEQLEKATLAMINKTSN